MSQQKKGDKCFQYLQSINYKPNEEACLLYHRNKQSYWVHGYKIFDPYKIISTSNGATVIEWDVIEGLVPVVIADDPICVKPTAYHPDRVKRKSEVSNSYLFHEVFK